VKICPVCSTEYPDDVKFCPNDGQTLRSAGPASDLVGQVVADRYHVVKKLGEGGMGQVYLAEHVKMGRRSAIKVMNPSMVHDPDAVARFNRDVFAHKPDLVVWQLGTNDVAWGGQPNSQLKNRVLHGIQTLKESGADIILMDLQYAPMVLASPYYSKMEAIISEAAREQKIGLFSRFALMRKSIEAGVSPSALVSWDGLHNTVDGYDCIGRALARSVSNTVP